MPLIFHSPEHEARFREENARRRPGGSEPRICGARTHNGKPCRNPPLQGYDRCQFHCGRTVIREWRERQRRAYLSGRMSHEEWTRAEARRARNRLTYRWQKDPWLPGATIDLGEHEDAFLAASGLAGGRLWNMPPAVLDWLRWKYRRLQIDRSRDAEWTRLLREDYPRRVRDAGPPPDDHTARGEQDPAAGLLLPRAETPGASSRRKLPDGPRVPGESRQPALHPRGRPRSEPDRGPDEQQAFARFFAEFSQTLAPLHRLCSGHKEQHAVTEALYRYVQNPADQANMEHWTHMVATLAPRGLGRR